MSLKNALQELLNTLDKLHDKYGGMRDTVVREELHAAIIDHFVFPSSRGAFPSDNYYAMIPDEGDEEVHKALGQFLNHPEVRDALLQLTTPQERLDAFQDGDVESSNGSTYDNYFGWAEHL